MESAHIAQNCAKYATATNDYFLKIINKQIIFPTIHRARDAQNGIFFC